MKRIRIFNTNVWNRLRYTFWSPVYDLAVRPFAKNRRRALELLALWPGERVLIVGAGSGLDLPFIPPGPKVTAIDWTPAMLRKLRRRADALNIDVETKRMDAQKLSFPDGSFNAAILHLILAVVPDPVKCIRETARVLRPGGRAVIFDKFAPDEGPIPWKLRLLNIPSSVAASHVNRRLKDILAGSGLKVVHDEPARFRGFFRIVIVQKG